MGLHRHVATSVSLPPVMLEDLKAEAKARDLSLSQLVREYIRSGRLTGEAGRLDLLREASNDDGE